MPTPNFSGVYLLHGAGESPDNLDKIEARLCNHVRVWVSRPTLAHAAPGINAEQSSRTFRKTGILPESLLVGFGLGGLVAAKLQELEPDLNLSVLAINAPTSDGSVSLKRTRQRTAMYSSKYPPLHGCANWGEYTEGFDSNFDVEWLRHGYGLKKYTLGYLISKVVRGKDLYFEVKTIFPQLSLP